MTGALIFLAGTFFGATLGALAVGMCYSAKKRDSRLLDQPLASGLPACASNSDFLALPAVDPK